MDLSWAGGGRLALADARTVSAGPRPDDPASNPGRLSPLKRSKSEEKPAWPFSPSKI